MKVISRILVFLALIVYSAYSYGQEIRLDFMKLPGKEARVYYFRGRNVDSLLVKLDTSGKGYTALPSGYKGMVRIIIGEAGGTECIGGEPVLQVKCSGDKLSRELISYPGSKENEFLYSTFAEKSRLMQLQGWINGGLELYAQGSPSDRNKSVISILEKEKKVNEQQTAELNKRIQTSPLYAARFIELAAFTEDLFTAENRQDTAKIRYVKDYLHHKMNWEAFYTSGQLWDVTHNYYISMFNKEFPEMGKREKENRYASDINTLLPVLQEPVRSGFLQSVIMECERFGWDQAGDQILTYITDNKIPVGNGGNDLSRILAGYQTRPGNPAPALDGFKLPPVAFNGLLLIFYESGCGNCTVQLEELKKHYAELQSKGIRIISISGDNDKAVFEYHSKDFPWPDKLCDYKGFEGDNFKNYGIIATPTIYMIDRTGIVKGRYAKVSETGVLD